ncbi:alpha/beta-hydrolase [Microthyrium microscopicum]|uniref:Alpha/beta-hydrolase n=1 Tax=Microthyrium microscopicum TaxID=703497 RepID=A0A6A6UHN2_9PEZI|nr:alpha/beta-hydrolase [Microthyrium microscopicum]
MESKIWTLRTHVIPASHMRGYRRGVRDETKHRLRLSVNQYTPNKIPDVGWTVIFVHGVGSTKESYEPFFAGLLKTGLPIRSIWAADLAWHGQSYVINEEIVGDEPHWDDAARDILHMVNSFQDEMPPPLVAIGQSYGGYPIVQAALIHPRLFTALVALEPMLVGGSSDAFSFAGITTRAMARRRDTWISREEARKALLKNPYYAAFDPAVFEKVMKHDLRDVSSSSSAVVSGQTPVTLTTPKMMEVTSMMRIIPSTDDKRPCAKDPDDEGEGAAHILPGFYRTEPDIIQHRLGNVRPSVLYVFAENSTIPDHVGYQKWLIERTGTGRGGSGGPAAGMVEGAWVKDSGHPMPLEKPKETAKAMTPWLNRQLELWQHDLTEDSKDTRFWTKEINPLWLFKLSKM